ncbi:hypothetical protein [Micromonospora sp. IBSANI012]
MTTRRVTPESLGAWLVKGNADAVDLASRFAADLRVRKLVRPPRLPRTPA